MNIIDRSSNTANPLAGAHAEQHRDLFGPDPSLGDPTFDEFAPAPETDPTRRWSKEGIEALVDAHMPAIFAAAWAYTRGDEQSPTHPIEDTRVTLHCDDVGDVQI